MRARLFALALAVLAPPGWAQGVDLPRVQAAAEAGNAEAQYLLGEAYRQGLELLQHNGRAAEWYARAAAQGDARAAHRLGVQLLSGLGVVADPARGMQLLEQAAASGAPEPLLDLGRALQQGVAGSPDPARAAELYRQAAQAGSDEAAVSLAVLYQDGIGVAQDLDAARALYQGPAERGHPRAQNNLGLIYARAEDYEAALPLFAGAAEQGFATAMRNLAALYENGFGVAVDEARAQALLRAAAGAGDAATGSLVMDPRLQPVDPARVGEYARAASLGDPIAAYYLGHAILMQPEPDGGAFRTAARAFEAAAGRGLSAAMANYGMMLFAGRGVLQDYAEGYAWLTLAAHLGAPEAISLRDALAGTMPPAQVNAAHARAEAILAEIRP